jgi:predicted metal-dependent phosphotriesterase family hydrolase
MDTISKRVLPRLRDAGVSSDEITQMLVANPLRLLQKSA